MCFFLVLYKSQKKDQHQLEMDMEADKYCLCSLMELISLFYGDPLLLRTTTNTSMGHTVVMPHMFLYYDEHVHCVIMSKLHRP